MNMSLIPSKHYQKKILNESDSTPLTETFSKTQVSKRIAFYKELNEHKGLVAKLSLSEPNMIEKKLFLSGHKDTTTVRVYMRETVSRIAAELFSSKYTISVENINHTKEGEVDKNHGHVIVLVKATKPEIEALLSYIKPGASFYVYDGEKSKYIPGNTGVSEFIITKANNSKQPQKYWRRSQSFIAKVEELP